jgi:hypothetical protein
VGRPEFGASIAPRTAIYHAGPKSTRLFFFVHLFTCAYIVWVIYKTTFKYRIHLKIAVVLWSA